METLSSSSIVETIKEKLEHLLSMHLKYDQKKDALQKAKLNLKKTEDENQAILEAKALKAKLLRRQTEKKTIESKANLRVEDFGGNPPSDFIRRNNEFFAIRSEHFFSLSKMY